MLTSSELVWLLAAVAKGDTTAFERLYNATRAKLYGIVLRILRRADLAEEVMLETYLHVWQHAGAFDSRVATPITWMVSLARNRAIDIMRRQRDSLHLREPASAETAGDGPGSLHQREITEDLKRLLACLGALDEERRRLILLAYYNGWSRDELAITFGKPVNTIKSWLRRSLIEIRERLGS